MGKPTNCLLQPHPAVEVAPDLLRLAAAALEAKKPLQAHALVRAIDWTAFEWFWVEGGLEWERRHDKTAHPAREPIPTIRILQNVKLDVARRDRWRCRYCGLRVAAPGFLKKLHLLLAAAMPLGKRNFECHPAYRVVRCTQDHVEPRSPGGANDTTNLVTSCGGCNFNKGSNSLEELNLLDPRHRPPVIDDRDGLYGRLGTAL